MVIGTKFGYPFRDGSRVGTGGACRPARIRDAVEGSLRGSARTILISFINTASIRSCRSRTSPAWSASWLVRER